MTGPAWRVGTRQPTNLYCGDLYMGVIWGGAQYAAAFVAAMNQDRNHAVIGEIAEAVETEILEETLKLVEELVQRIEELERDERLIDRVDVLQSQVEALQRDNRQLRVTVDTIRDNIRRDEERKMRGVT